MNTCLRLLALAGPAMGCLFNIEMQGGTYPYEISWTIVSDEGQDACSGGSVQFDGEVYECTSPYGAGSYTLTCSDSYGDGPPPPRHLSLHDLAPTSKSFPRHAPDAALPPTHTQAGTPGRSPSTAPRTATRTASPPAPRRPSRSPSRAFRFRPRPRRPRRSTATSRSGCTGAITQARSRGHLE